MRETIKARMAGVKENSFVKIMMIGLLSLILLIPVGMIESLIDERFTRLDQTQHEISNDWGRPQTVGGPILTIPFYQHSKISKQNKNGDWYTTTETKLRYAYFLPDTLNYEADLLPEVRYRGLFKMPVYKTKLKVHGQFNMPDFDKLNIAEKDILWQRAFVSVMLADKRGLNEIPVLRWNDKSFIFGPAEKVIDTYTSIVQTDLKDVEMKSKSYNTFSFELDVRGSRLLRFLPFGKQTQAFVQSNWKTPKFIGTSLPLSHKIKESGFKAQWKTLELNRNYPQQWRSNDFGIEALNSSIFGVEFLMPVSVYQQTNRSAKYAVLFVVLTFISYFLFEILAKLRIHPVQYLLIGLSVCLFYLNLLSISEHLNFELAYLLSSAATVLMASGYSVAVLKSRSKALIIAFILSVLYGFLFILLNAETYSLLMGGIGLFIILGTIMFVTRKMEWYSTPATVQD